ncbi:hypothetical protein BLOT_000751 [Blomia tropicalis]|nr:hypothetical protein BLOT_000751 [Blomia tropicalis]
MNVLDQMNVNVPICTLHFRLGHCRNCLHMVEIKVDFQAYVCVCVLSITLSLSWRIKRFERMGILSSNDAINNQCGYEKKSKMG